MIDLLTKIAATGVDLRAVVQGCW